MTEEERENILVMAIFVVSKDDVIAAADEMGIPREEITEDVFERVTTKVSQGLSDWRESIESMVKEAIKCPLGLVCSATCAYREAGNCLSADEVK